MAWKIQYKFYSEHPDAASEEYLAAHPEILANKQIRNKQKRANRL